MCLCVFVQEALNSVISMQIQQPLKELFSHKMDMTKIIQLLVPFSKGQILRSPFRINSDYTRIKIKCCRQPEYIFLASHCKVSIAIFRILLTRFAK